MIEVPGDCNGDNANCPGLCGDEIQSSGDVGQKACFRQPFYSSFILYSITAPMSMIVLVSVQCRCSS